MRDEYKYGVDSRPRKWWSPTELSQAFSIINLGTRSISHQQWSSSTFSSLVHLPPLLPLQLLNREVPISTDSLARETSTAIPSSSAAFKVQSRVPTLAMAMTNAFAFTREASANVVKVWLTWTCVKMFYVYWGFFIACLAGDINTDEVSFSSLDLEYQDTVPR